MLSSSASALQSIAQQPVAGLACRSLNVLSQRCLSVLSWGRNAEGQCGVEGTVLVREPTPIMEFHGDHSDVHSVRAGALVSCAVTSSGEAWTWGDGKCGKLGQGSAENVHTPTRVESFVDRVHVESAALGDNHTLFLDQNGGIWSCGENKEGQCGLGTPLEVIAMQHRKTLVDALRAMHTPKPSMHQTKQAKDQKFSNYLKSLMHQQHHQSQGSMGLGVFQQRQQQQASWHISGGDSRAGSGAMQDSARLALGFGGFDVENHFSATGLQPGHHHTPTRLGRDQHPLMEMYHQQQDDLKVLGSSGLESERVIQVDASKYFSVAVTATGDVWTFGADYHGSLGSNSSWSTSAQKVEGALAHAISDNGGAVQVAAGNTFCLALTANGKVVVWGKVPGSEATASEGGLSMDGMPLTVGHRVLAGVVPNLPPIKHIAAGRQHALLSDGERAWVFGKWSDEWGKQSDTASWKSPQEVLNLPADGVTSLACGTSSSAVVTGDGRLYMWGRLLDTHHAEQLMKKFGHGKQDFVMEDVRAKWPGFGADVPTLVNDLVGVKSVSLGGWHALVLME